jgi:hypothetical protein
MADRLPEWVRDMRISDQLMRDIASDARAHNVILSRGGTSAAKDNQEPPRPRGTGWQEAPSVDSWQRSAGISAIDELCSAQDAVDKAERLAKLAETVRNLQVLKEAEAAAKKLEEKGPQK